MCAHMFNLAIKDAQAKANKSIPNNLQNTNTSNYINMPPTPIFNLSPNDGHGLFPHVNINCTFLTICIILMPYY